jgi:hypothetical protein
MHHPFYVPYYAVLIVENKGEAKDVGNVDV